jgi:hypothetical protein
MKANFETEKFEAFLKPTVRFQKGVVMNDLTLRRLEMCVRVAGFLAKNPVVFGTGSQGSMLVAQFKRAVDDIRGLIVKQASGIASARASAGRRQAARQMLVEALDSISRCAAGIAVTRPGFGDNFRLVRNVNDTKLLVCAHWFAKNAALLWSEFVRFEMAPTFVDDLNSKIKDFEQAMADHSSSRSGHVATTGLIDNGMQRALEILAQLDPIVSNKVAGDVDLTGQWKNVRHVESAWVSKKDPVPAPPAVIPPAAA